MEYALILLAAVVTFGGCWLLDKGFTKKYRSAPQQQTGLSVRLNKHYCTAGIVLTVLGVMALFTDFGWIMVAGGCLLILHNTGKHRYSAVRRCLQHQKIPGKTSKLIQQRSHILAFSIKPI